MSNKARFSVSKLEEFTKGWFVGDFEPSILKTRDVEVSIKTYAKGDTEVSHHHKKATEITVVVAGRVRMLGQDFTAGSVIKIFPGTSTDFIALEQSTTVVVKHPGVNDDKYLD